MQTIDSTQAVYQIATATKPLSTDEQKSCWLVFNDGITVLKNFRQRLGKVYQVKDKNFQNFNAELIADFKRSSLPTASDRYKVKKMLEAKDQLVYTNMRMIIKLAKQVSSASLTRDILIQSGIEGMVKSLLKFKPTSDCTTKGKKIQNLSLFEPIEEKKVIEYKLSSYSWFWIRHSIKVEIEKNEQNKAVSNKRGYVHVPLDTVDSQGQNLRVEDSEMLGSVPLSLEELQILDSNPLEIALNYNLTIDLATEWKTDITNKARKFYQTASLV